MPSASDALHSRSGGKLEKEDHESAQHQGSGNDNGLPIDQSYTSEKISISTSGIDTTGISAITLDSDGRAKTFLRNKALKIKNKRSLSDIQNGETKYNVLQRRNSKRSSNVHFQSFPSSLSLSSSIAASSSQRQPSSLTPKQYSPPKSGKYSRDIVDSESVCATNNSSVSNATQTRLSGRKSQLPPFYEVIGIIGAYTSPLSVVVADVLTLYQMPQISHASTTDVLSDKTKYPFFFRTLPADR